MSSSENSGEIVTYERLADENEEAEFYYYIQGNAEYMPTEFVSRYVRRIEAHSGELEDEVDDLKGQVKYLEGQLDRVSRKLDRLDFSDLPSEEAERVRNHLFSAVGRAIDEMRRD